MDIKKLLFIFIPAILFILIGLSVRIKQYVPLNPKQETEQVKAPELVPLLAEDPITGDRRAPITIIAFEDLACAGCKTQSEIFDQLIKEYPGTIKVIWKLLNVTTFPYDTEKAHAYAFCAQEQDAFSEFKQAAFANYTSLNESTLTAIAGNIELNQKKLSLCLQSERPALYREKTNAIAKLLNIQSVPALFMNNKQIQTPATIEQWKALLQL